MKFQETRLDFDNFIKNGASLRNRAVTQVCVPFREGKDIDCTCSCTRFHGFSCILMGIHWIPWDFAELHAVPWNFKTIIRIWVSWRNRGVVQVCVQFWEGKDGDCTLSFMDFSEVSWNSMKLHEASCISTRSRGIPLKRSQLAKSCCGTGLRAILRGQGRWHPM